MTTPTLPQAAQIALDALVLSSTDASRINPHQQHVDAAITALREALAQPAAPAVPDGMVLVPREPSDKQISAGNALSWPFPSGPTYRAMIAAAPTPQAVPAPAVREPLTEDAVSRIWREVTLESLHNSQQRFARAIEQAHGIGGGGNG